MTQPRLASLLREARLQHGMSLRDVERATGIGNAHVSQLETGTIGKPDPALLWTLAELYGLEFEDLIGLAGHSLGGTAGRGFSVALRALSELTEQERRDVLTYMAELKRRRHD
jgi:transcriptional regulator with XRE-family HTH domain